jgi:hypothetical protein
LVVALMPPTTNMNRKTQTVRLLRSEYMVRVVS